MDGPTRSPASSLRGYSQRSQISLSSQTEDKEFDDLEERFHWVSLCVTEMKNNVAVYLDNLEVRILPVMMAGLGWVGPPRQDAWGPSDKLAKAPAAGTQMEEVTGSLAAGQRKGHRRVLPNPQLSG